MGKKTKTDREALNRLRSERASAVEKAKRAIKSQNQTVRAIKGQIKTEGKTIPEIALATGIPSSQVLAYVATLRKYGQVVEKEKDGDYFRYQLID